MAASVEEVDVGISPVELRLFGPLELWVDGHPRRIGSPLEKRVLAALLLAEGRPVPLHRLIDQVWDERPPPTASDTVQVYLSRLRSRLSKATGGSIGITRSTSGTYAVTGAFDSLDLSRFRQLRQRAAHAKDRGDITAAVALLREAESLLRGEPLTGLTGHWADGVREALREELSETRTARIRLEMAQGHHGRLLGELKSLAARDPVDEPAVADLMLALHRNGRTFEALETYRSARDRLLDDGGLEPGRELGELHQRILRGDPALLLPEADTPRGRHFDRKPIDNLPRDNPDFSGRHDEIRLLTHRVNPPGERDALPLAVVHGMPGVGKTTLAIRVANRLRDLYRDRIYLDLRAYGSEPPGEPREALRRLLGILGTAPEEIPSGLDERGSLWRDLMAERQAVVILDDARDAGQIRPLLPGSPRCAVIVTSRHQLTDLEGARDLLLEVPPPGEAAELLTRLAGRGRIANQTALRRAVELCGCHPLALRLAAGRFRHQLGWDIEDLADRLSGTDSPLEEIDAPTGIASAFTLCYAALPADRQRLFRLLSLHPGPDFTLSAAIALTGDEPSAVRAGLVTLLDGHLIEDIGRDRFRLHELMRDFAGRTSRSSDPAPVREEALERVLDHYLVQADHADRLSHPQRRRFDVSTPQAVERTISTAEDGDAWLDLERGNLLAATRAALHASVPRAILFPHVLSHSFMTWGVWETAVEFYRQAIRQAEENGEPLVRGQLLAEVAAPLWSLGSVAEALSRAEQALAIGIEWGDTATQAQALIEMARGNLLSGRRTQALTALDRAVELSRTARYPRGVADALNLRGIAHAQAGEFREALRVHRAILDIYTDLNERRGVVKALANIGETHFILCEYEPARRHFERALAKARLMSGRTPMANLYTNLGNVHRVAGAHAMALSYYQRALSLCQFTRDTRSEADVLTNMGRACLADRRFDEAWLLLTQAEGIARQIGDQQTRQQALVEMGETRLATHHYGPSRNAFQEALHIGQEITEPFGTARALDGIGRVVAATEGMPTARIYFEKALALYQEMAHPHAHTVRERLRSSGASH